MRFVFKFLLRWNSHYKKLKSYRERNGQDLKKHWVSITKDISMFTAGYSCAREILGKQQAYTLYRRMFLDTGKMEMRWLWPSPETFSACDSPEKAIQAYWLEFMQCYQNLGVLTLSIEASNKQHTHCVVSHCAYAMMFNALECPELSNLVREMEQEALTHICSQSAIEVKWQSGSNGAATILLHDYSVEPYTEKKSAEKTMTLAEFT